MDEHPEADLWVYAVWFIMICGDDKNQWDDSLLTDERVTEFWDEDRLLGLWFAELEDFREEVFGPIAWDIFFLFGSESSWGVIPAPLVSTGNTVLRKSDTLRATIEPLLARKSD